MKKERRKKQTKENIKACEGKFSPQTYKTKMTLFLKRIPPLVGSEIVLFLMKGGTGLTISKPREGTFTITAVVLLNNETN